jgi:hypothetical protein
MDRLQLRAIIQSGRAVALDCHGIGKSIPGDDPIGPLFKTDILNKTVLIKRFDPALPTARQDINVSTVVYFPYDFNNPYDGGESIDYNAFGFPSLLLNKVAHGAKSPELLASIDHDVEILSLIESMHSLDPFMFKSKAEQYGKESRIHPDYFAISPVEWEKIRGPIRAKISKLVAKALGNQSGLGDEKAKERYVEKFLAKIWQATDIEGIEPFVKAMQLSPVRAPEIFFAWKAVCYYEVRLAEVLGDLKTLFQWVGNNNLCFPSDAIILSEQERTSITARRSALRVKLREGNAKAQKVIREYDYSYNQFIENDQPQKFMEFLDNSGNSYLNLAAHVSTATHGVNLWKRYMTRYGAELRSRQFLELLDGLTVLNNLDVKNNAMA